MINLYASGLSLIVDGNKIGIAVALCVGRACNRACWTVYRLFPRLLNLLAVEISRANSLPTWE